MQIPIVNEQDEILCHKERDCIEPLDIIRAVGIWVTNQKGDILLAQRSFSKTNSPGLWGTAAGGVVDKDESYEISAAREAAEEIGLIGIPLVAERKFFVDSGHPIFGYLFSAIVPDEYPFIKQDEEVEKLQWFTKDEVLKFFKEKPEEFIPSFKQTINYLFQNENPS